jgi:signal peptidase I
MLCLALLIRTFVVQAFKIPSGSMEPTLEIGDHILVNKFIYGIKIPFTDLSFWSWEQPQRGDVVVFIYPLEPEKDFIKRVIAVESSHIAAETAARNAALNGLEETVSIIHGRAEDHLDQPADLVLANLHPFVRHTVSLVRLDEVFDIVDDLSGFGP